MRIVISSGHGLHVRGASGVIDEVDEARRVTEQVADILRDASVDVNVFHENEARNQSANVSAIIRHHNAQQRDLDVSVHFNSVVGIRDAGIGVETLYRKGNAQMRSIASRVSKAIAKASGLKLRRGDGTWARKDLGFLNSTNINRAILLEVCFVNSRTDARLYQENFEAICPAIAEEICGQELEASTPKLPENQEIIAGRKQFPISEDNVRHLVELDVINSPDYWRGVSSLEYLDTLLTRAAEPGRLDRRIDNGITDLDTALGVLHDAGITDSTGHWYDRVNEGSVPYLHNLLINIANRARIVLEKIVRAEARGEDLLGQTLVANVVLNRHNDDNFPDGIYNVVMQRGINTDGRMNYQFTPVGNGSYAAAVPSESVRQAVTNALNGEDYSQGATYFHSIRRLTPEVFHERAVKKGRLVKLFDHGNHRFYVEA